MNHRFSFSVVTALLLLSAIAMAQVPSKVSYQGLLTTPAGQTVADGH